MPTAPYGIADSVLTSLISVSSFKAFVGQLMDQKFGILPVGPVYCLAFPGFWILYRLRSDHFWRLIALFLSFYTLMSAYYMWWGGFSPPCRFLIPVIPLLWHPIEVPSFQTSAHTSRRVVLAGLAVVGLLTK